MIQKEDLVKIGVLLKPHGVSGEVLIRLIPELFGTEPDPSWLFVDVMDELVPFEVQSVRNKGEDGLLLSLENINNEEKARRFQGADVFIDPSELNQEEESDQFNPNMLIGAHVIDENFGAIGILTAIHDIRQNPLAEIDHQGKSILVPLQDEFILSFNKEAKELIIKTPPGLIDLYLE